MNRPAKITVASIVGVMLIFTWVAWHRRWISDDGLIFVRVARNILAGNGPVFNAFERTEANTSALWPWLIAAVGGITRANLSHVAVGLGLVFSLAGMALAMDGARRWMRSRGSNAALVPAAILIPVALFPFWDYATSGLETGLTTLWLGAIWWLLIQLTPETSRKRQLWTAVVLGLGPLVRPDLAVASGTFLVAQCVLVGATRRRVLAIAGAAAVLPLSYELFRGGFYGTLVPLPALAKGASAAVWDRGWTYLVCYVRPFALWLPAALLLGTMIFVRRELVRRDRILVAAPLVAAAVMAIYVVRVGGDFMYARMWLPATFLAILPGAVLPLRKLVITPVALIAIWAIYLIGHDYTRTEHHITVLVEDERVGYVQWTHKRNPVDETGYINAYPILQTTIDDAIARHQRLLYTEGGVPLPIDPAMPYSPVFIAGRLGLGGALVPTDGIAVDTLGLANPIGARISLNHPEEPPGHQKVLPWSWLLADYADPNRIAETQFGPSEVAAARRAMKCGALEELLESVREPLTIGRFFSNLTGSLRRTRLEIPPDPAAAEFRFCGTTELPSITASSSCEQWGWSTQNVVDGLVHSTTDHSLGYSSTVWIRTDHPEWLVLDYHTPRVFTKIRLYPRDDAGLLGKGFPVDFKIQSWNGTTWVDQVTETDYPEPSEPQWFSFAAPVRTTKLRIAATHLQNTKIDGYVMQFAEIEVAH